MIDFSQQEKYENDVFDEHNGDFIRSLLEDDESQNEERTINWGIIKIWRVKGIGLQVWVYTAILP